jgi:erythromycin esterase-like protein
MLGIVAGSLACARDPQREELDWIRANAIPLQTCEAGHGFEDLRPLSTLIGDARIVALGECTHGTREVFQMKHRLVEYLASQAGFTIFSIEANMPEAYRLNEYVLTGQGDPKQLIAGMYFWTWNTEEVLAMVEWMRAFNRSGKGRIEFTGFDMQTPDVAMDAVLEFLMKTDPQRVRGVEETYRPLRNGRFRKNGAAAGGSFGVATATFPVEAAKGKRIRFSGWIKTKGVKNGYAGLWWRADGPSGVLAFDNMESRNIQGDTDWAEYALELDIPKETVNINFGALHPGEGEAWFDDLGVEVDGKTFDTGKLFDAGFEGPDLKGFHTGDRSYEVALDDHVARSGRQSLRMEFLTSGKPDEKSKGPDPVVASRACGDVVAQLEANRDEYLKTKSQQEVDWAVQNARVVSQCLRLEANQTSRDESMATNVGWILDHAPKDAKIVLWAHNGHVGRGWSRGDGSMGSFLDKWYGKGQVVIGFAAGEGRYTAMVKGKGLRSDNHLAPPVKNSYEEYFRASGLPIFVLDLRSSREGDPGSGWLTRAHPFRSIGALAMDQQFMSADIRGLYDAIIYLDRTTASRTLRRQ